MANVTACTFGPWNDEVEREINEHGVKLLKPEILQSLV